MRVYIITYLNFYTYLTYICWELPAQRAYIYIMMGNTNIDWVQLSDAAVLKQLGSFVKQMRMRKNMTQVQLAETSGLNRWTISQIENGESVTLSSLIQILRALDRLDVLSAFEVSEEISPLEYAKLKKKKRQRVRNKPNDKSDKSDLGW